jgi:NADPH:quinone reductase-like Zn-dependent oxidoreductase
VVATSASAEELERLTALGVDHVIDYREVEKLAEAFRRLRSRGLSAHLSK